MKTSFTEAELKAAYETCVLVKANSDNVLASGEDSEADRKWSRDANKFIKAYERVQAYKLAKSGKTGYMGDALNKLQGLHETLKGIDKTL